MTQNCDKHAVLHPCVQRAWGSSAMLDEARGEARGHPPPCHTRLQMNRVWRACRSGAYADAYTREELLRLAHMPAAQAAERLGICLTVRARGAPPHGRAASRCAGCNWQRALQLGLQLGHAGRQCASPASTRQGTRPCRSCARGWRAGAPAQECRVARSTHAAVPGLAGAEQGLCERLPPALYPRLPPCMQTFKVGAELHTTLGGGWPPADAVLVAALPGLP